MIQLIKKLLKAKTEEVKDVKKDVADKRHAVATVCPKCKQIINSHNFHI
jgi:hypothetical protein